MLLRQRCCCDGGATATEVLLRRRCCCDGGAAATEVLLRRRCCYDGGAAATELPAAATELLLRRSYCCAAAVGQRLLVPSSFDLILRVASFEERRDAQNDETTGTHSFPRVNVYLNSKVKRGGPHSPSPAPGPVIQVYLSPYDSSTKKIVPRGTSLPPQQKKLSLLGHLFLSRTLVFCAKKRLGHAFICPRMLVTG